MARSIDKQTMLDLIIEAKRTDPETGSFAEWLAEYLVEHLPTLTPPNEPMTCDGCVDCKRSSMSMCKFCIRNTELRDYYRRPPEGEADETK